MKVLLNRLVTVADGALCDCIHMVRVVEPVVAVIMANRCDCEGEDVEVGELGELSDITLLHDQGSHLQDISSVDSIVILDFWTISLVDLVQKFHNDLGVNLRYLV